MLTLTFIHGKIKSTMAGTAAHRDISYVPERDSITLCETPLIGFLKERTVNIIPVIPSGKTPVLSSYFLFSSGLIPDMVAVRKAEDDTGEDLSPK